MLKLLIINIFFLQFSSSAFAYVGPGLGAGVLWTILGFIIAIFAGLFGILWFPIKRLFKKKGENKNTIESKNDNNL